MHYHGRMYLGYSSSNLTSLGCRSKKVVSSVHVQLEENGGLSRVINSLLT